jgi:hypothetical protein
MSEIKPNAVVSDLCRSLSKAEMVLLVSKICEEHWVKTDSLRRHVREVRQEWLRRRWERLEEQSAAAYEELRTLEGRSELPTADELRADISVRVRWLDLMRKANQAFERYTESFEVPETVD